MKNIFRRPAVKAAKRRRAAAGFWAVAVICGVLFICAAPLYLWAHPELVDSIFDPLRTQS